MTEGAATHRRFPALDPSWADPPARVLLSSLSSDAHTWNLVYLQLVIEEHGHQVTNLGGCVPDDLLVSESVRADPDLVVISSVNGHGLTDGMRAVTRLRAQPSLARTPIVIGGKLGTGGKIPRTAVVGLRRAGYTAVFGDGEDLAAFRTLLTALRARQAA